MTDVEKAIEISKTPAVYGNYFDLEKTIELQRYNAAMLMAQWKQEMMIEKAVEWLKNNWRNYVWQTDGGIPHFGHWENDFKKAMEENL